jgi:hypothetical protein
MKSFFLQNRIRSGVIIAAILALLLIAGSFWAPDAFFRAYWFALMVWAQLSIGALIVLLAPVLDRR